jgi:hypothetical protein
MSNAKKLLKMSISFGPLTAAGLPDLVTVYQNGENFTKLPQHYLMAMKYIPDVFKIFQMTIKCTNIFNSKALQNLPKLVFLV